MDLDVDTGGGGGGGGGESGATPSILRAGTRGRTKANHRADRLFALIQQIGVVVVGGSG